MADRVSVGVVGLGWMGKAHLADLVGRANVKIVGVCDPDLALSHDIANAYHCTAFRDDAELYDSTNLDAVWICTPPNLHSVLAAGAMRRGVHVYLEKPIARERADAELICGEAMRSGVVCAIGYQWHSLGLFDTIRRELIEQRIVTLIGQSIGPTVARDWFLDAGQSGGSLLERGSHHLDLARMLGGEPAEILVVGSAMRLDRGDNLSIAKSYNDDALTILLRYPSGATATIAIVWSHPEAPRSYSLDVIADRGAYRVELDPRFTLIGRSGERSIKDTSPDALHASNSRFLAAVVAKTPELVPCSPSDASRTLALALAGEESLLSGHWVAVE